MATIRATFILTDKASGALDDIHDAAQRAENRLEALDKRLDRFSRDHHQNIDRVNRDLDTWEREQKSTTRSVVDQMDKVEKQAERLTRKKHTVKLDVDTREAERAIGRIERLMSRATRGRSGTMGAGADRFLAGFGGGFGRRNTGITGRLTNSLRGFGVNVGFLSARASALAPLILFLGGPAMTAAAAGVGALTVGITALGAAAFGVVGVLAAFGTGVAAMAVPIGMATSRLMKKREALEKATERMDKYKKGTKEWRRAQYDVNKALASFTTEEKGANDALDQLQSTWAKFVTNGKSGERSMNIITRSFKIAAGLVPTIAKQMDRFTGRGVNLFGDAQKNLPRFQNQLDATMSSWPHIFETLTRAAGNFGMGFLRMLQAASPFLVWMADKTLEISQNFSEWMNDPQNFKKVRDWFVRMEKPVSRLAEFGWSFASSFLAIAGNADVQSATFALMDSFERGFGRLETMIPNLSRSFEDDLLPTIEKTITLLANVWELTAPGWNKILDTLTQVTDQLNNMGTAGTILATLGLLSMTSTGRGVGRGLLGGIGAIIGRGSNRGGPGGGARGAAGRVAGRAGSVVNAAADIAAPNVHVTNTIGTPVPVLIVGDLSAGRLWRGGGRNFGRMSRLAGALGLATVGTAAVAATRPGSRADVPAKVAPPGNPEHRNQPTVNPQGMMSPAAAMQTMMQGGGKPLQNYIHNATSSQLREMMRMGPSATVAQMIQGELGWRGSREKPFTAAQRAQQGDAALAAGSMLIGGPLIGGALKGLGVAGRAIAGGIGGTAANAARPAAAMATEKPKRELSGFAAMFNRIDQMLDRTTARGVARTQQRTQQANRNMLSSAQGAGRSMIATFQSIIAGVASMVQQAASSVGGLIGSLMSGGGGAGSPGGYGPGAGSTGKIVGAGQLGELAGGLAGTANSMLNMIPGVKTITSVKSDHSKFTASGNISDHWFGKAFDFVTGSTSSMKKAGKFIRANASKFGVNASQTFDPGYDPYGGHSGSNAHVHVGFKGDGRGSTNAEHAAPRGGGAGVSISNKAGVTVSFEGAQFYIRNDDDYDEVMRKLAEKLEQAFGATGDVSTSEMVGD